MEYLVKKIKENEVKDIYSNSKGIFAVLKNKEEINIPSELIMEIINEVDTNSSATYCSSTGKCISFFKDIHFEQLNKCINDVQHNINFKKI
jgi:hypothetical protein